MASPKSLKRPYDHTDLEHAYGDAQPAQTAQSPYSSQPVFRSEPADPRMDNHTSTPVVDAERSRPSSPALSQISSSALGELGAHVQPNGISLGVTPKKPRLTFAEKESTRLEREARDWQKAEERAKREQEKEEKGRKKAEKAEERAKKVEERRTRDLVRDLVKEEKRRAKEQQNKAKEDEKKKRDDEKKKKEDEKNRKDKSQLRLNAFFVAPSLPTEGSNGSPVRDVQSPVNSRRSSVSSPHVPGLVSRERSTSTTPRKAQLPYYERLFPPFFIQSHTTLASGNRLSRDDADIEYLRVKLDRYLRSDQEKDALAPTDIPNILLRIKPCTRRSHRRPQLPVKDIIARMHGTARNPIDLTWLHPQKTAQAPVEQLKTVPIKFLKFAEDVRPPFIGTYTKLQDGPSSDKLRRNPFTRALPATDYDYDSEAEWEEPGEGEDLDSEGEEELGEEEDADDMEGFLDDAEADEVRKRRPIIGDLEPTCTGLCWEDSRSKVTQPSSDASPRLNLFRLDIILDNPQLPIDPYSTAYWQNPTSANPHKSSPSRSMEPPRVPLTAINRLLLNLQLPTPVPSDSLKARSASDATTPASKPPKQAHVKRYIAPELLDEFKAAVQGSYLTKLGLIEVLKKQFPKQSKSAIQDTLTLIAERVGLKESEKQWVLKDASA